MPKGKEEQPLTTATGSRILHQYVVIMGVVHTRKEWMDCLRNGEDMEDCVLCSTREES